MRSSSWYQIPFPWRCRECGWRKWKLRLEQSWPVTCEGECGASWGPRAPLSRLCSHNATLRLRVSQRSNTMSTLDCCSQTSTFVAPSQTINFPEFSLNQGTTNDCVSKAFVNVYRGPIAILQTAIETLTQPGAAVISHAIDTSLNNPASDFSSDIWIIHWIFKFIFLKILEKERLFTVPETFWIDRAEVDYLPRRRPFTHIE